MNRRVVAKPDVVVAEAKPPKKSRPSLRAWREQHFYSLFSSLGRLAARPWATSMTLAVLSLALAFPLLFWLLLDNARGLSGTVEDSRAISVFLKSGTDAAAVEAMAAKLRQHAGRPIGRRENAGAGTRGVQGALGLCRCAECFALQSAAGIADRRSARGERRVTPIRRRRWSKNSGAIRPSIRCSTMRRGSSG